MGGGNSLWLNDSWKCDEQIQTSDTMDQKAFKSFS